MFNGSQEHQSGEFKGEMYSVIFHQVTVASLTDGLKRSLNSLRFPVVAAQSKNECSLRFLFLFAGTKRKSSNKDFLENVIGGAFASSEAVSEELDLLQATYDGLIDPELQVRLLAEIEECVHFIHLDLPPCSTFSRARMANRIVPPAIRSKVHPWGFPWLKTNVKVVCEEPNSLLMFAFAVMEAASKALQRGHQIAVVFERPEDLGSHSLRTLASAFQLERCRGIVKSQAWSTFAFHQCDFNALWSKPTRQVTNVGARAAA